MPIPPTWQPNAPQFRRFVGAAVQALAGGRESGHTYMPIPEIAQVMGRELNIRPGSVIDGFRRLSHMQQNYSQFGDLLDQTRAGDLYVDLSKHRLIGHSALTAEMSIASAIHDLNTRHPMPRPKGIYTHLRNGNALTNEQIDVVDKGLSLPFLVVSGGPGVGKTSVLQVLCDALRMHHDDFTLAAPTGVAAARLTAATGYEAQTIHRLLKFTGDEKSGFKPSDGMIDTDVLIIDEVSMLDVDLGALLFSRIDRSRTRVILVGDPHQLPSVGPGEILRDLLSALFIPRVTLTKSQRQREGSPIEELAECVLAGRRPDWKKLRGSGRVMVVDPCGNPEDMAAFALTHGLARDPFPKYRFKPIEANRIQGLVNSRDCAGVFNDALQRALCSTPLPLERDYAPFYYGSRVMQNKNNYHLGVYNGEIGTTLSINPLIIDYGDRRIRYPREQHDQLQLAYFSTVHRFQGNECEGLMYRVLFGDKRRLFYTAVTRVKGPDSRIMLMATLDEIESALQNTNDDARHTLLPEMLY